jgi:16S rRNA (uracil1498-N3)-methyltransferase
LLERYLVPVPRHRVFAPDASTGVVVTLAKDEAHHLKNVLRLESGAGVGVFDGAGREWSGRVAELGRRAVTIQIEAPIEPVPEPRVRITLAIGLLKGDQMDAVVRDATMLGAAVIAPISSAHVAAAWTPARLEAAGDRWRRIALASARQCGRAVIPAVAPILSFEARLDAARDERIILAAEPGLQSHAAGSAMDTQVPASVLVLVGPEGGWSGAEVDLAVERGAWLLNLGPRTLRAETAPVVVLASLWTRWNF